MYQKIGWLQLLCFSFELFALSHIFRLQLFRQGHRQLWAGAAAHFQRED